MNMGKRLTQEEFKKRVEEQGNGEYTPLEEYQGANVSMLIMHKNCDQEWKVRPSDFFSGSRCPFCYRKLVQKKYKKRIENEGNGEYSVIGEYESALTPILMKHKRCGKEWRIRPNDFLNGHRCPRCNGKNEKLTQKEFEKRVEKLGNGNFTVLEKYKNNRTPTLMRHEVCGHEWKIRPYDFFNGHRCSFCFGRPKIDTSSYIQRVKDIDENYQVLSEYKNNQTKIKMIHLKCGNIFQTIPGDFLRGHCCPHCKQSRGERDIANFLKNRSIEYEVQKRFKDCIDKRALPFDFYIPTLNTCIEFDGKQHFEPVDYFGGEKAFKEVQRRDGIKTKYCKEKGIKLLRIRYDEDVEEKMKTILQNYKA